MSSNIRLISRLDIKGENLIKGVHLEGLRIVGKPDKYAKIYYKDGIDEILYIDSVASLYGRNNLNDIVKNTVKDVFIPITVGGGIRSTHDVEILLRSGADKVAIGTAAVKNPYLISEISKKFGSQCMVLSIVAKKIDSNWKVFTDNGRNNSGKDVTQWAKEGQDLHAGEILLTSIDQEGTNRGFDIELLQSVSSAVNIPVIASGGFGKPSDFVDAVKKSKVDAIAVADVIHYKKFSIKQIKNYAINQKINIRHDI